MNFPVNEPCTSTDVLLFLSQRYALIIQATLLIDLVLNVGKSHMKKELQISIIKELMSQLDEGRNVDAGVQFKMPTDSYVCPERASREQQEFFRNHPQLIGLSAICHRLVPISPMMILGSRYLPRVTKMGCFMRF